MVDPTGLEPATPSLRAKYQTSSPPKRQSWMSGNRRERSGGQPLRKVHRFRDLSATRVTTSLARTPPRYAIRSPPRTALVERLLERRIRDSSPPTKRYPGEQTARLFGFQSKKSASS